LGTYLYWTDVHSHDIHWTRTGHPLDDATSIIVGASHGCAVNNGGFDFFCVPNGESTKASSCSYLHSIKEKSKGMLNSTMYLFFHSFQFISSAISYLPLPSWHAPCTGHELDYLH
jgi:hypothetical protein